MFDFHLAKTSESHHLEPHFVVHLNSYFWGAVAIIVIIGLVFLSCLASFYIVRYFLLKTAEKLSQTRKYPWLKSAYQRNVFHRLSFLTPAFVLHACVPIFAGISFAPVSMLAKPIEILTEIFIVIMISFAFSGFLASIEDRYNHFKFAKQRPIKSYLQVIKIIVFILAILIIASVLMDKSLKYFLTGLSAMTAVILLIFKDSILGFVASVQLAAHDMIRIGDWIELSAFGADGIVIDISLNTVKIQNFDNSVVMIPSYVFLSNGVKNWRGMTDAGARRIKRAVYIDINTIKFCDQDWIKQKAPLNLETKIMNITNLGLFRIYLENYLSSHPDIHTDMTLLVHEQEGLIGGNGLPLELYVFTKHTDWANYERFQAEIFEHIYAMLSVFELKVKQNT